MIFFCEHWEALSSLLLSVVAIFIAIWSSRNTSKEATRQIEGIKELAKLQIEALSIGLDMEMKRYQVQAQKADEERKKMSDIQGSYQLQARELMMREFEEEKPLRELRYHAMYIQELRGISKRLELLKENLKS